MDDDRGVLLDGLVGLVLQAGREIMAIYAAGCAVALKADASPVTVADTAAEAVILAGLARLSPDVPVVAEEATAAGHVPEIGAAFFLVDPLDGTREFVNRRGEFTVNIALVEGDRPSLGVVLAPACGRLFAGDTTTGCAWSAEVAADDTGVAAPGRRPIRVRPRPPGPIAVAASRSHNTPETEAYLARYDVAERVSVGSSLKFCLVAAGEADLYPRLGPTHEWDTAAGHAVLSAAGGEVFGPDGAPLAYGKPKFFNSSFVAVGALEPLPLAAFMPAA